MADEPATPVAEELKIRVKSASVEVFITLNAKFLAQPLDKALINPFIKVYNKKSDVPVALESLISIHVTGAACPDGPVTIDTAKDPTVALAFHVHVHSPSARRTTISTFHMKGIVQNRLTT